MGKQYNKVIKRRRRNAYLVRKKSALALKEKPKAKATASAKKTAAQPAPAA